MKNYSLKKSLSIFLHACKVYKNKKETVDDEVQKVIENHLDKLKGFIAVKDKKGASKEAKIIEKLLKNHFPLSNITKFIESFAMLAVALFFAILIRQSCFEFVEIPTGSMRPTFKECDRLMVSKAQFGINIPLTTKHLFFSPDEVKRMNTVVLTSEGMDVPNNKIRYFHVFPGYKQFTKRMIGLPEDSLYFYGGKIYGVDKDGNDITPILQQDMLSHIEHIPYIYIGGRSNYDNGQIFIKQNNETIAKLNAINSKKAKGEMISSQAEDVYQLWGMENYAMSRIVPVESLYFSKETVDLLIKHPESKYFLEITHHPSVKNAKINFTFQGAMEPTLGKQVSFIPLDDDSLRSIWNSLYTARFVSNKGYLESFGRTYKSSNMLRDRPKIKGHVPDGTYEFFNGIAYRVKWQNHPFSMIPSLSIPEEVPADHPYANFTPAKCVTLYNMGIEQSKYYMTHAGSGIAPSRYAYFRDGDLYLMNKKIFDKESSELSAFVAHENEKAANDPSYTPFVDQGAPLLADGTLDVEKVKAQGLHIPKKSYYVLGDNHAQSGDSREFGFVPEDNLRGTASLMMWAPGGRYGAVLQQPFAWFNIYKLIVWSLVAFGVAIYYTLRARRYRALRENPLVHFITPSKTSWLKNPLKS